MQKVARQGRVIHGAAISSRLGTLQILQGMAILVYLERMETDRRVRPRMLEALGGDAGAIAKTLLCPG